MVFLLVLLHNLWSKLMPVCWSRFRSTAHRTQLTTLQQFHRKLTSSELSSPQIPETMKYILSCCFFFSLHFILNVALHSRSNEILQTDRTRKFTQICSNFGSSSFIISRRTSMLLGFASFLCESLAPHSLLIASFFELISCYLMIIQNDIAVQLFVLPLSCFRDLHAIISNQPASINIISQLWPCSEFHSIRLLRSTGVSIEIIAAHNLNICSAS